MNKDLREKVRELFAAAPARTPADVANELLANEADIIRAMPEEMVTILDNVDLVDVYTHLREWGDVLIVMDVEGSIFEMVTPFPKGGFKFGYYNMSDSRTILKGHLKMDGIGTIALVSKPFHGVETKSVQFFSPAGRPVFKVYLRRNKDKSFLADQLAKFEDLKQLALANEE
ncbi:heme utilization cystosolic carrier protein HutX [Parendozoicomonas haliclonae]|uniref:ChuX-like family protein n=1 Tax=Parendozoicomonas haliclonae TaxID=1960125 RepID=A0A1X7AGK7_9GAMM|nr:heme utilization cystosolic carrier protein HutX [Parendozoicomonas haliclonae]SMA38540.1 ChuX-like family protein [Parendozoicomonas haliclonae]